MVFSPNSDFFWNANCVSYFSRFFASPILEFTVNAKIMDLNPDQSIYILYFTGVYVILIRRQSFWYKLSNLTCLFNNHYMIDSISLKNYSVLKSKTFIKGDEFNSISNALSNALTNFFHILQGKHKNVKKIGGLSLTQCRG